MFTITRGNALKMHDMVPSSRCEAASPPPKQRRTRVRRVKHIQKLLSVGFVVFFSLASPLGPAMTQSAQAATSSLESDPAASYLWSLTGSHGSLVGPSDENLTLTISGAPRFMTRFTDRPLRQAFVVANRSFVSRWPSYFSSSAPNAVLAFSTPASPHPLNIVLTLSKPRWNPQTSTWTFHAARILKQMENLPGSPALSTQRIPTPKTFTGASLMIDASGNQSTQITPNSSIVATSSGSAVVLYFLINGMTYWNGVVTPASPTQMTSNVGNNTTTLLSGGVFTLSQSSSGSYVTFHGTVLESGTSFPFYGLVFSSQE